MKIGKEIAMSKGKTGWPVLKATYKSEFVSHWRDSFYRKVFTGWETVGFFDTKEEAKTFIKESNE